MKGEKEFLSRVALSHVTDTHVLIDDREWENRGWRRRRYSKPFCRYFYDRLTGLFFEWVENSRGRFVQKPVDDERLIELLKLAALPFADWK